ncbi:MAG: hypothetical protein ACOY9Y_09080 [Bacillota bacterium]
MDRNFSIDVNSGQIDISVEQGYEIGRKSTLRLMGNVEEGRVSVYGWRQGNPGCTREIALGR